MHSYRNGYPRQWFRPARFDWFKATAYVVLTFLLALVWIGVGFVAWIVL